MGNQLTSDLVQAGAGLASEATGFGLRTMREFTEARDATQYKPGLENFGHTCYMNVSLQSLFACEEFRTQVITNGKKRDARPIHKALGALFEEMAITNQKSLSPRAFRDAFVDIHTEFRSAAEEHDVAEFLNCLLDELNDETSWHQRDVRGEDPDFRSADEAWNYYLKFRANSYLVPMFAGQYQYITTCPAGHEWSRYQSYWSVSLPIPKERYKAEGTWDIMHCLVELGRPERLPGINCAQCGTQVEARRIQTICRVPDFLILSLNVFEFTWTAGKLSPGLRINPTINVIGNEFSLYAIILHHGGTPNSGHYTCYVRIGVQWFTCNDRYVKECQMPELFEQLRDTYVMIYEKDESRAIKERGAQNIEDLPPGLIETSLIGWRDVPLPPGFVPEPPPLPRGSTGPAPQPKPESKPPPPPKRAPYWEKKFGDWTVLEPYLRETPRPKPLLPEDEAFLAKKGIYISNKQLGYGEFGNVYVSNLKGYQRDQHGRPIDWKLACKIVSLSNYDKGTISVREATERMAKEEEIVKKLSHLGATDAVYEKYRELNLMKKVVDTPHIVTTEKIVRIYHEKSKFPFPYRILLFMEVCPLNLDRFLNAVRDSGISNDGFGERRSCVLIAQIGDAVRYMHERFIAHLDIKPANILIRGNPQNSNEHMFKLCDFGLSQEREFKELSRFKEKLYSSESSRHVGHFLYAAPEVLDQSAGAFNIFKADIYALGAVLADCMMPREPEDERATFTRKEQFQMYRLILAVREIDRVSGVWVTFDPIHEFYTKRCSQFMLLIMMHTTAEHPNFRFHIEELLKQPIIWKVRETVNNYVNFN